MDSELKNICQNLKNNFLKHIIFRVDFLPVEATKLEKASLAIKDFLSSLGFARAFLKENKEANVVLPREDGDIAGTVRSLQTIFCFADDIKGMSVEVSTTFLLLNINSERYIPFLDYYSIALKLLKFLTPESGPLLYKRFGIRKQNICLLNKLDLIGELFINPPISFIGGKVSSFSRSLNVFVDDFIRTNLSKEIAEGVFEGSQYYKYMIDIDSYCNDGEKILSILANDSGCMLNESIFAFFVNSLSKTMIDALCKECFEIEGVLGVSPNE